VAKAGDASTDTNARLASFIILIVQKQKEGEGERERRSLAGRHDSTNDYWWNETRRGKTDLFESLGRLRRLTRGARKIDWLEPAVESVKPSISLY
jgi:hypothetical protein